MEHANNNGAGRAALTMASRAGVAPAHLHLETSAAIVGSSTPVEIKSTPRPQQTLGHERAKNFSPASCTDKRRREGKPRPSFVPLRPVALRREEEGKWWRRRTREAAATRRASHRRGRPVPSPWSRRDSTWGETERERERFFFG